ncbi:MAG: hypothetical protein GWP05_09590 [Anaerolineaceae bacterium]|nr:hypothetical protein [Anaerolineaceae bacterium]
MKRWGMLSALMVMCLTAGASAGPLKPRQVRLDGMKVTIVPLKQSVEIDPLPVSHATAEFALKTGTPSWRTKPRLPYVAWTFRALKRGSLVVTLAGQPGTRLVEGKDYVVNYNWGAVCATKSSKISPGTKLHFEFDWTQSRIDLLQRTPDGRVVVRKGKPDRSQPLLPEPAPGNTPLLSVYLAPNTTALTMANINLIDPAYDGVPPVSGRQYISKVKAKLAAGKPVTIAFLGDSITAQRPKDFRDGKGSFVDRFATYMETKYPDRKVIVTPRGTVVSPADKQIVIVKAGLGGNNSSQGLARIDKDVLAHKPDLVIILFGANDENGPHGGPNKVPPKKYGRNLSAMIDRIRASGGEVILMTPSMKTLGWEHTAGNLSEYAAVGRRVAAKKEVCLVDNFRAWEDLPRRGYNYIVFLGTCINHPVDLGHDLFFRGLKAAFETGNK